MSEQAETKEAREKRLKYNRIAQDIAAQLGRGYQATSIDEPDPSRPTFPNKKREITHPDKLHWRLCLIFDYWDGGAGRISITGEYPKAKDQQWGGSSNEITVSYSRSPQAIARDISRRLLPDYVEELPRKIACMHNGNLKLLQIQEFEARLQATGARKPNYLPKHEYFMIWDANGPITSSVDYLDRKKLVFKINNLTTDELFQLIYMVRTMNIMRMAKQASKKEEPNGRTDQ